MIELNLPHSEDLCFVHLQCVCIVILNKLYFSRIPIQPLEYVMQFNFHSQVSTSLEYYYLTDLQSHTKGDQSLGLSILQSTFSLSWLLYMEKEVLNSSGCSIEFDTMEFYYRKYLLYAEKIFPLKWNQFCSHFYFASNSQVMNPLNLIQISIFDIHKKWFAFSLCFFSTLVCWLH